MRTYRCTRKVDLYRVVAAAFCWCFLSFITRPFPAAHRRCLLQTNLVNFSRYGSGAHGRTAVQEACAKHCCLLSTVTPRPGTGHPRNVCICSTATAVVYFLLYRTSVILPACWSQRAPHLSVARAPLAVAIKIAPPCAPLRMEENECIDRDAAAALCVTSSGLAANMPPRLMAAATCIVVFVGVVST